ncbi:hypothetical protein FCM35_KLT19575 [Carex littledalei]|uniref:Mediator complex subunit 15 KIX domain-containing protein n=1 Tax=Carex littledalei TaxID=544730 RepID=A0A833VXY0_9POAL|nr:hypothetical protein FCM35_KLT19575 [Carex littledalei]
MAVESTLVLAQKYPTLSELEHSDWRYEFPQMTRQRICNHIENLFRRYFTGSLLLNALPVIAKEFEARIFHSMAKSEADYLGKIIFKLFSIIGYLKPIFKYGQMESSSSTQSANQTNPELRIPPTTGQGWMPQTSHCNAVPPDVHRNPATSALRHDGNGVYLYRMPENSATRTGSHIQGQDWQAETLKKINYLVKTYGKRFRDVYYWAKDGPKNKGRSILGPGLLEDLAELDLIAKVFLITQKGSISFEMKEYIQYIEKRILFYIDLKVASDSSEEIYSKLETSNPDKNQKLILNELIKAFLMDKAKKLGVYIHLVDDDDVGYIISYSMQREIVEIINDWCDHKIKILTQARPTVRDIENELFIWQTPGSKLQQWCLLKHLPMKVGPARKRPDPLLEKVRSIWKMRDNELQQPSPSQQQHLQQQVNPAWQPAVPVPQHLGPTKKWPYATLHKGRLIPQSRRMRPCFPQLQHYHYPAGSPLQWTGAVQRQSVVVPMQQTGTLWGRSKKSLTAVR